MFINNVFVSYIFILEASFMLVCASEHIVQWLMAHVKNIINIFSVSLVGVLSNMKLESFLTINFMRGRIVFMNLRHEIVCIILQAAINDYLIYVSKASY